MNRLGGGEVDHLCVVGRTILRLRVVPPELRVSDGNLRHDGEDVEILEAPDHLNRLLRRLSPHLRVEHVVHLREHRRRDDAPLPLLAFEHRLRLPGVLALQYGQSRRGETTQYGSVSLTQSSTVFIVR